MSAFVELHAQSAFSFLEGAEQPETLAQEAARRGMSAMALCASTAPASAAMSTPTATATSITALARHATRS